MRKVKKVPSQKGGYRPPSPQFNTSMAVEKPPAPEQAAKPKKKKQGKTTQGAFSSLNMR